MADALAKIEEYEAALDAERKHYKRLIETQEKIAQDRLKTLPRRQGRTGGSL